jgi:YD repeat-containing protein
MGRLIATQTDNISGEQVVYTYDALNRLASATATSGACGNRNRATETETETETETGDEMECTPKLRHSN